MNNIFPKALIVGMHFGLKICQTVKSLVWSYLCSTHRFRHRWRHAHSGHIKFHQFHCVISFKLRFHSRTSVDFRMLGPRIATGLNSFWIGRNKPGLHQYQIKWLKYMITISFLANYSLKAFGMHLLDTEAQDCGKRISFPYWITAVFCDEDLSL